MTGQAARKIEENGQMRNKVIIADEGSLKKSMLWEALYMVEAEIDSLSRKLGPPIFSFAYIAEIPRLLCELRRLEALLKKALLD